MDESEEIEAEREENSKIKKSLDEEKKKKNVATIFKKLTILFIRKISFYKVFLPEYDILLISSSNKRITAWKYNDAVFNNINTIEKKNLQYDKSNLICNILISASPQYRMAFDNIGKNLYTGQNDGKINKWDLSKVIV